MRRNNPGKLPPAGVARKRGEKRRWKQQAKAFVRGQIGRHGSQVDEFECEEGSVCRHESLVVDEQIQLLLGDMQGPAQMPTLGSAYAGSGLLRT